MITFQRFKLRTLDLLAIEPLEYVIYVAAEKSPNVTVTSSEFLTD